MPSYGQLTFLLTELLQRLVRQKSVNALVRATYISTEKANEKMDQFNQCQCPRTGNLHFYICINCMDVIVALCQCPRTGNLHFY